MKSSSGGSSLFASQPARTLALVLPLVIFVILGLIHLYFGRFTGDEGFFSLASRNVMEGLVPYRDFMFWQMPLLPYVYGLWFKLTGPSIESARYLSLLFGAGGIVLAMGACQRRSGFTAAAIVGVLLSLSLHYVFDTVSFKSQPLSIVLIAAVVFVLAQPRPRFLWLQMALAMLFMSLALLGRLSMLPALLLLWVYALWVGRREWKLILVLVLVNAALLALVFRIFWADGNLLFGVYRTHQEYFGKPPWSWERVTSFFLKGWLQNELPLLFGLFWAAVAAVVQLFRTGLSASLKNDGWVFRVYLLGSIAGMTLLHMTNVQSYPVHQASFVIMTAVLAALTLADFFAGFERQTQQIAYVSVVVLCLLSAPFQEWIVNFDGKGSLSKIDEVRELIEANSSKDDGLLSFNAELAVDSGRKSSPGYDMSEFSYFPAMADERAEKLKVVNLNRLVADISSGKYRVLCLGDREFSVMAGNNQELAGKLKQLIDEKYRQVGKVDGYGQFFQPMYVFVLK